MEDPMSYDNPSVRTRKSRAAYAPRRVAEGQFSGGFSGRSPTVKRVHPSVDPLESTQVELSSAMPRKNPGGDRPSPNRMLGMVLGSAALGIALLVQRPSRPQAQDVTLNLPCQQGGQPQAMLSEETVLELLAVPEREAAQVVRTIVPEPYCVLPALEMRAGIPTQREAFLLSFNPQAALILLYEEEEYAGYGFYVSW
jgi:hypothetical protein